VKKFFLIALALLVSAPAIAQLKLGGSTDNLLEPEKAFRFSAQALDAGLIEVRFAIADGYYMYRERFRFAAEGAGARLGAAQFPGGEKHKDEFFGEVETYRGNLTILVPFELSQGALPAVTLTAVSQGCADVGVCYIPTEQKAQLQLAAAGGAATGPFRRTGPSILARTA